MFNRKQLLTVSSAALLIGASFLSAPAQARQRLGGINLETECARQHGNQFLTGVFLHNSRDPYSWKCRRYIDSFRITYTEHGMDLNRACREQYRDSRAYAEVTDRNNAYSWKCFRD